MEKTQFIGIAAGTLTAMSLIPQLIKSLREKKVEGISPFLFIILIGGNGLWSWYGILKEDIPIIATNVFAFCMDVSMLVLSVIFRRKA